MDNNPLEEKTEPFKRKSQILPVLDIPNHSYHLPCRAARFLTRSSILKSLPFTFEQKHSIALNLMSTAFDKGKLLRGAESIICVYYGREQQRDYLPGSISFNSTVAFRWLLQSLGLDGSEIVAPTVDDNRTSRGRSVQNEEVSLTDFLNLELEWPGDSERFGDLFPGITAISGASTEQALPKETRKPVENAILQVPVKQLYLKIGRPLRLL
ncbi:hypothetical protein Dimus_037668 [Dionaea muscipula]